MFQQIANTLGQKDEKGYQVKTLVSATIKVIKDVEYSQSSGKPKQGLLLAGDHGAESWVTLMGNDVPLGKDLKDGKYQFLIWPFKADQSPKATFYCWIQRAAPKTSPQQAAQSTISPSGDIIPLLERIANAVEKLARTEPFDEFAKNNPVEEDGIQF